MHRRSSSSAPSSPSTGSADGSASRPDPTRRPDPAGALVTNVLAAPVTSRAATTGGPLLRVDGLDVSYGPTQVVHGVSFSLERGSSVALIGESGSGKSTIARALLRLLPPDLRRTSRRG